MWELEQALKAITGMAGVTLQPAAGAHGELTGILMIRKALEARGESRSIVLVPDSAHGTNPATASFAGYQAVEIPSAADGTVDLAALAELMDRASRRGHAHGSQHPRGLRAPDPRDLRARAPPRRASCTSTAPT